MNLYEAANSMNVAVGDLVTNEMKRLNVSVMRLEVNEAEQVAAQVYGQNLTPEQVADVVRDVTGREVNIVERMGRTWIQAAFAE